jgi:hypothetical protein
MKSKALERDALVPGRLVLLETAPYTAPHHYVLRFVEHICDAFVHLAPVDLFLDVEQVTERVPLEHACGCLRIPQFECGDPIFLHGRPGYIANAEQNDLHVYVTLQDGNLEKPIYTNLIHVDVTPTLSQYTA